MSARQRRGACVALLLASLAAPALAAEPTLPRDGWVSWDVPAIENAPAWCCLAWKDRDGVPMSCKLDGHSNGIGTRNHETTDTVTVYARSTAGKLDRLQVLSATCPVETKSPVRELGDVTADDSARWLIARVDSGGADAGLRRPLLENALAALAMHRSDQARDALIRVGNTDNLADVRSKAWFWLGMSGAPGAETAIGTAVRGDRDDGVREQAVFALSRLPEERAARALIALAEDRSLAREQRRRAVFWLAQSDSAAALAYLDRVFAATGPRQ